MRSVGVSLQFERPTRAKHSLSSCSRHSLDCLLFLFFFWILSDWPSLWGRACLVSPGFGNLNVGNCNFFSLYAGEFWCLHEWRACGCCHVDISCNMLPRRSLAFQKRQRKVLCEAEILRFFYRTGDNKAHVWMWKVYGRICYTQLSVYIFHATHKPLQHWKSRAIRPFVSLLRVCVATCAEQTCSDCISLFFCHK